MATTQVGTYHIFGLSGVSISATIAGYISPNLQSLKISDNDPGVKEIKNQVGQITGLIIPDDDVLECTFETIPEGTSSANASKAAAIPAKGSTVTVSGLPTVIIGGFSDALNASTTNPWFYLGGGSISGSSDDKWTATLPLKRFKNIASGTAL